MTSIATEAELSCLTLLHHEIAGENFKKIILKHVNLGYHIFSNNGPCFKQEKPRKIVLNSQNKMLLQLFSNANICTLICDLKIDQYPHLQKSTDTYLRRIV